jgi:hypothetical protein
VCLVDDEQGRPGRREQVEDRGLDQLLRREQKATQRSPGEPASVRRAWAAGVAELVETAGRPHR